MVPANVKELRYYSFLIKKSKPNPNGVIKFNFKTVLDLA